MRSLIITEAFPCAPGGETTGMARRFGVFVRAIGSISSEVELLHLVPGGVIAENPDAPVLARDASDSFGFPVRVSLVALAAPAPKTFRAHYLDGLLSVSGQPQYQPFAGETTARAVLAHMTGGADLVLVHRMKAMAAVLRSRYRPSRLFFDLDDLDHKMQLRSAFHPPFWPGKLFYAAHALPMLAAERRAAAMARATFVASELDRRHLARLGFGARVAVIPNAVALPEHVDPVAAEPRLLFLGNYAYPPNAVAADRLIRRIWPLVRARRPDARLLIAGLNIAALPASRQAEPGVEHTGFVDDLAALYARCRAVCCPITLGGGTRVKLVEAAAHAKPMVSTRVGAEGLAFVAEEEILLRDDDDGFAAACVRLLDDDALCRKLGRAARSRAAALYDASAVQARIAEIMTSAA